jgi:uncharacterized protein YjdB
MRAILRHTLLIASIPIVLFTACDGGSATDPPASPPPPAVGITISPDTAEIRVGETVTLSGTVVNSTNTAVSYSTSNAQVAAVSSSGVVTGVSAGSATITATAIASPSAVSHAHVSVLPPIIVSIVAPPATLTVGTEAQLSAAVTGTANGAVTWETSAPLVASVSIAGVVKGLTTGTAVITARSQASSTKVASTTITITPVPTAVPAFSAQPAAATIVEGQTATFAVTATGIPQPTLQWLRNGNVIAGATSVTYTTPVTTPADSGAVFTVVATNSAGSTTSGSAILHVRRGVTVALAPRTSSIHPGDTLRITATVGNTTDTRVTWSASVPAVASVSATGLVTAISAGQTYVRGRSVSDSTKADSVLVSVTAIVPTGPPVSVSPANAIVPVQQTLQLSASVLGGGSVAWSSSGPAAQVSQTGLVTGMIPGKATITARLVSDTSKKATSEIVVTYAAPSTLTSGTPVTLSSGPDEYRQFRIVVPAGTSSMVVTLQGNNGDADLWIDPGAPNDEESYCYDGEVTSNAICSAISPVAGDWYITVYAAQAYTDVTLVATFNAISAPVAVTVTPANGVVEVGKTLQLSAVVTGTANTAVTWSSNFTSIAEVSPTGMVTGRTAGSVEVTATSVADPSKKATSAITVSAAAPTGAINVLLTTVSAEARERVEFKFGVPSNATQLKVETFGGTGDISLEVGAVGKTQSCVRVGSSAQTCTIQNPEDATWSVAVTCTSFRCDGIFVRADVTLGVRTDGFTISTRVDSIEVQPGFATSLRVDVSRINGFTGPVTTKLEGLPTGVTSAPVTMTGIIPAILNISALDVAPPGRYTLTLRSSSPGYPEDVRPITLVVQQLPQPGFRFHMIAPRVVSGGFVVGTITIDRDPGFTETVSISMANQIDGASGSAVTFSGATTSQPFVINGGAPGSYDLIYHAKSNGYATQVGGISVLVYNDLPKFTLASDCANYWRPLLVDRNFGATGFEPVLAGAYEPIPGFSFKSYGFSFARSGTDEMLSSFTVVEGNGHVMDQQTNIRSIFTIDFGRCYVRFTLPERFLDLELINTGDGDTYFFVPITSGLNVPILHPNGLISFHRF